MAKSATMSFRESAADFAQLQELINHRRFSPLYLLMGEESYFIDALTSFLLEGVLPESERAFNQAVVYGRDTDAGTVVNMCRQVPMGGAMQLVVVREAQALKKLEQLAVYAQKPISSTILVLCHKEKNLDKRSVLYKNCRLNGTIFESVSPRDYEIGAWLSTYVRLKGFQMSLQAERLLIDHLGTDLSRMVNELEKLTTSVVSKTDSITEEDILRNIGISRDFNNFELTKAISGGDLNKALRIAAYFEQNPKDNPLVVTISALFAHFQRIFILCYLYWQHKKSAKPLPPEPEIAKMMHLTSTFFLKEYQGAAIRYPMPKVFAALGLIREYDMKSKGMNVGSLGDGALLRELLLKMMC